MSVDIQERLDATIEQIAAALHTEHLRRRAGGERARLVRDAVTPPAPRRPASPGVRRIFLHVGAPKSGTTFVQNVLWRQWSRAAADGLLLPGAGYDLHVRAAKGLAGWEHRDSLKGAWRDFLDEVASWPGDVAISTEALAALPPEVSSDLVRHLEAAGLQVHVVVTARDLARQMTAGWQERIKRRGGETLPEWSDRLRRKGGAFRQFNGVAVAERWSRGLPAGRVHVVTLPPPGAPRELLWQRFAGVVGLDADRFSLDLPRANTSLGREQAEVLRRVNLALGDRLPVADGYPAVVKKLFSHRVLEQRPGTPLALGPDDLAFAREWSAREVDTLVALSTAGRLRVVGDPTDLLVSDRIRPAGDAEPTAEDLLAEAAAALADLLALCGEHAPVTAAPAGSVPLPPARNTGPTTAQPAEDVHDR